MIYRQRDFLLRQFKKKLGLEIMRTFNKEDYLNKMNRIRFFISADRGMREYMIKNFEALGCGCILVAYRQGGEEEHLGFRDMENVILYSRFDEAVAKIKQVESNPTALDRIANAGYQLARERFTTQNRDCRLFEIIALPYEQQE
jgi:spore maturation protein CgeB